MRKKAKGWSLLSLLCSVAARLFFNKIFDLLKQQDLVAYPAPSKYMHFPLHHHRAADIPQEVQPGLRLRAKSSSRFSPEFAPRPSISAPTKSGRRKTYMSNGEMGGKQHAIQRWLASKAVGHTAYNHFLSQPRQFICYISPSHREARSRWTETAHNEGLWGRES